MKTVYLNVLSRLSTELFTKNTQFSFCWQKNIFSGKKIDFQILLITSRGITGGMKTVYFNVFSRLSTELSTKNIQISFCYQKIFFWQKIWFSNFANIFQEAAQEVWKPFILTFFPISVPNYLQKTSKFRFAIKKYFSGRKFDFRILLISFKRQHRRYENRLF